jgi:hypothetical protein
VGDALLNESSRVAKHIHKDYPISITGFFVLFWQYWDLNSGFNAG